MIVRELVTRLGFSVNDSNMKRYESSIDNVKKSAEGAANSFRSMFGAFIGFSALKSITNTADTMQSLEFRVGELTQTTGEAGKAFDEVAQHAVGARQNVEAYGNLYIRVAQSTGDFVKSQEDVLKITDTVSKALVLGGASAMEQKSAMFQLSQGFQAGKLQGNDYKIFMAAMSVDFKKKFAEASGFTLEQLKEMSTKGQLTAKLMANALIKVAPSFDESFKKVPLTFAQAWTIITGKFGIFINRMNRESHAITNIAGFFVDVTNSIEKSVDEITKSLGGGTQVVKLFGLALGAALAPAALAGLKAAIILLLSQMAGLFALLLLTAVALEDLYQWMTGGKSIIGRFIGDMHDANGSVNGFKVSVVAATAMVGTFLLSLISAPLAGFVSWIVYAAIRMYELAVALFTGSLAALGFTWPLWAIVAAIAAVIAAGYLLYDYFTGDFASLADFFGQKVDWMLDKWKSFKDFFSMGGGANITAGYNASMSMATASGVGNKQLANTQNNNINVTMPPGSSPEFAGQSIDAVEKALGEQNSNALGRQMGAYAQ